MSQFRNPTQVELHPPIAVSENNTHTSLIGYKALNYNTAYLDTVPWDTKLKNLNKNNIY